MQLMCTFIYPWSYYAEIYDHIVLLTYSNFIITLHSRLYLYQIQFISFVNITQMWIYIYGTSKEKKCIFKSYSLCSISSLFQYYKNGHTL